MNINRAHTDAFLCAIVFAMYASASGVFAARLAVIHIDLANAARGRDRLFLQRLVPRS